MMFHLLHETVLILLSEKQLKLLPEKPPLVAVLSSSCYSCLQHCDVVANMGRYIMKVLVWFGCATRELGARRLHPPHFFKFGGPAGHLDLQVFVSI